ncbi:MAG: hypothetical protein ACXABD_17760 [Candidatus Thorarchaeota archaeon]
MLTVISALLYVKRHKSAALHQPVVPWCAARVAHHNIYVGWIPIDDVLEGGNNFILDLLDNVAWYARRFAHDHLESFKRVMC